VNFASLPFVLGFLPLLLLAFHALRGPRAGERRLALLILASALFYGASGWNNIAVMAASMAVNFAAGRVLVDMSRTRKRARKAVMWLAVLANLGLLLGFKLSILFVEDGRGFSASQDILLPLALSFITFQQIGFVVSCHSGSISAFTLPRYLFFVLFFPQLLLGPIVRFEDIDRQVNDGALARVDPAQVATGLAVFALALAKKVLVADRIGEVADGIFAMAEQAPIGMANAWMGLAAFQFHLFFDFTAYAEMAIGLAMMVGMKVPLNFDRPFFSRDRAEFWQRWHISFAAFIRGHVFLPLMRRWHWPAWAAMAITGILSGLWHGLGPTFVLWGLIQTGILLWLHFRAQRLRHSGRKPLPAPLAIALTFLTSCLVGGLFRAPTLAAAGHIYWGAFGLHGWNALPDLFGERAVLLLVMAAALVWLGPDFLQLFRDRWHFTELRARAFPVPVHWSERLIAFRPTPAWGFATALALLASIAALAMASGAQRFVYVQF
jgi:alginate O-acetyltransferase complex protein AlgI